MRVRCAEVYHWLNNGWRLVSAQNTLFRDGVSRKQHVGESPAYEPRKGLVPVGNNRQVLEALNANYVRAFREADVAWLRCTSYSGLWSHFPGWKF